MTDLAVAPCYGRVAARAPRPLCCSLTVLATTPAHPPADRRDKADGSQLTLVLLVAGTVTWTGSLTAYPKPTQTILNDGSTPISGSTHFLQEKRNRELALNVKSLVVGSRVSGADIVIHFRFFQMFHRHGCVHDLFTPVRQQHTGGRTSIQFLICLFIFHFTTITFLGTNRLCYIEIIQRYQILMKLSNHTL